jgi:hypothetical protein
MLEVHTVLTVNPPSNSATIHFNPVQTLAPYSPKIDSNNEYYDLETFVVKFDRRLPIFRRHILSPSAG